MVGNDGGITAIRKTLSGNDVGQTRGHQAGIYIPRKLVAFFPKLDCRQVNPRADMTCLDAEGTRWVFRLVHYNNRARGGTRDEYRLTHTTVYVVQYGLHAGDEVEFSVGLDGDYHIRHTRTGRQEMRDRNGVLHLGASWKVISY